MKEQLFKKYQRMIQKRAHFYSNKYGIDYEEMESQGYLIFCEALENYDVTKASFGTHLFIQLTRLKDYAGTYKRQRGELMEDYFSRPGEDFNSSVAENIESRNYMDNRKTELMDLAKKELKKSTFPIFEFIVGMMWEREGVRKPSVNTLHSVLGVTRRQAEEAWEEIKNFWQTKGCKLYA